MKRKNSLVNSSSIPPTLKEENINFNQGLFFPSNTSQEYPPQVKANNSDLIKVFDWQWREIGELAFQIREAAKNPSYVLSKQDWIFLYNSCIKLVRLTNTFEYNSAPFKYGNAPIAPPENQYKSQLNSNSIISSASAPSHPAPSKKTVPHVQQSNQIQKVSNVNTSNSPPVTRCCQICFVTESPVWRSGPNGQKTLCNACGLYYSKRQRHLKLQRELKEKELSENQNQNNQNQAKLNANKLESQT